uniref:CACTA en-spm transposon protein n=1 Tax=Cucumis melo TaxID=3656 RepID=A0A9I9E891_CUCME
MCLTNHAMFLKFKDDLDNIEGGSLSVGDNTSESKIFFILTYDYFMVFFSATCDPTPRRRAQSRLLELECHVAINGCIPMTIAPGAEKPIFPHDICFSQAIGRLFVLDFNDQAMNRFIEHQMLTTFKEFRVDYHRHFKKYSDPEKARNNPPNALVGRHEDWYFLCDHYMSHAFQEQSSTNKAARQKQPYNHSSWSKSFLQRQYKLAERKGEPVDRVELFRETYAAEDAHNQMLELQSQPTPEGSQPLSEDEICDQVLDRRPDYSKGRRVRAVRRHLVRSPHKKILKLNEALERIEVQDRNHQALASQVERMQKLIEEFTLAQQGPPHGP